jgi:hypothetical protein
VAQRVCKILHEAPAAAKAACCQMRPSRFDLVESCVRTLSASIQAKALVVDEARLDACEKGMTEALADCEVASSKVPRVEACEDLFDGRLTAGASCRSSLECPSHHRCHGVTTTRHGRCGEPRRKGLTCETARDPLAGLVRQDLDREHRECSGFCASNRCAEALADGAPCAADAACKSGVCASKLCTQVPHPRKGEPCRDGRCAPGLRCGDGDRCDDLLDAGGACKRADDCKSSRCSRSPDGGGTCERACTVVPATATPATAAPSATAP